MVNVNASNGILPRISGLYLSDGQRGFPPGGPDAPERMQSVLDVPEIGLVRITYRLASSRRHKSRHWFWVAMHAEAVEERR